MFQITRIKVFQNSHCQTQFLIKPVAALLVWSSNLLTPNQCLRLKRSVDREIIFTLRPPASDTPVISGGKLPFSQKQRKVWEETEEENRKEMRVCKDPWRVSHKASAMTNITLLRCWQGRGKIEKDIKKRAIYNRWLTEGLGWTLKDSKELFLMTNQRVWLGKDSDCVNISPAAAANPYSYLPGSPIFFLPPALVLLGNQQFQNGLMQYKYKMLNPKYGLSIKTNHIKKR